MQVDITYNSNLPIRFVEKVVYKRLQLLTNLDTIFDSALQRGHKLKYAPKCYFDQSHYRIHDSSSWYNGTRLSLNATAVCRHYDDVIINNSI